MAKKDQKKLSVIIPVYNAEKYLEKSLLILSKQTLDDIEFICINDASKDNSLNILKAFKEVFPDKFVVIDSPENKGPGGARNLGLEYAHGEYIGFMDSDDYVHEDMFRDMYSEAKNGDYDIVKCGYYSKQKNDMTKLYNINGLLDTTEKIYYFIYNSLYIWDKIYKKSLLDKLSMFFRENIFCEDTDFFLEAVLRANRVSTLPKNYYYYNFEENSETYSRLKNIDLTYMIKGDMALIESLKKRIESIPDCKLGEFVLYVLKTIVFKNLYIKIFLKKNVCIEDFIGFHKYASKYFYDYSELKSDAIYTPHDPEICAVIFNTMTKDPETMFKNVKKAKKDILDNKLGRSLKSKFSDFSAGNTPFGGFSNLDIT
ncbi:MAG: glycosyltransferase family 2 protein [Firmicutes bacterium]|nr:glycosyltransferase family 2 protein [Bacillota bacterium]